MTFTITIKPVLEKIKDAEMKKRYGSGDWFPVSAMEFHVVEDDFQSARGHLEDLFPFLKSDKWSWSYGPWDGKR